ncbi:MAG: glycosyl transferase family 1 [Desulfovibrio sp.]|nr:glycosyl transferase family 1 [Desulfovibrio sp.]
MPASKPIYLAVSLDVEEEGLFCGRYAQKEVSVQNTQALPKLKPLLELGVRPTLFCAYSVLADERSRQEIKHLATEYGAEIAAHLHHWNTPPLNLINHGAPRTSVPSKELSAESFLAKLKSVLELAEGLKGSAVTSFRMGRWDLWREHFALLAQAGIVNDASIRPLHGRDHRANHPDHFNAPQSPYLIPTPSGHIFEVPLTVTPLVCSLTKILNLGAKGPSYLKKLSQFLQSTTNYWGALALLPAYHPLWAMQAVTRLFLARGGRVLSLTWHSSEMQAGATPHLPTESAVAALLGKVTTYVSWLMKNYPVRSLPMNELRNNLLNQVPIITAQEGDYTTKEETCSTCCSWSKA